MLRSALLAEIGINVKKERQAQDGRMYWSKDAKEKLLRAWEKAQDADGMTIGRFSHLTGVWDGQLRKWFKQAGGKVSEGALVAPPGGLRYEALKEPTQLKGATSDRDVAENLRAAGVNLATVRLDSKGARLFTDEDRNKILAYIDENYADNISAGAEQLGIRNNQVYTWRANMKREQESGGRRVVSEAGSEPATRELAALAAAGVQIEALKLDASGRRRFSEQDRNKILAYLREHFSGNYREGAAMMGITPELVSRWRRKRNTQLEREAAGGLNPKSATQPHPLVGQTVDVAANGQVVMPWQQPKPQPVPDLPRQFSLPQAPTPEYPASLTSRAGFLVFETDTLEDAVALLKHLTSAVTGRVRVAVSRQDDAHVS